MTWIDIRVLSIFLLLGSISATKVGKIIGGHNTVIKHYPFAVSIRTDSGHHGCGGSIISDRHILTAAHCVYHMSDDVVQKYLRVHSGTTRIDKNGTVHRILSVHSHPNFSMSNEEEGFPHDIAILTLKDPIVFNKYQKKIKLPSNDIENYQVAEVVGWGRTSRRSSEPSLQLQKLRVVLMTSDKCKPLMTYSTVHSNSVCAFRSSESGACHGDSGGPIVSHGAVVGVVSRGDSPDCAVGVPDVYTKVFAYKDFIESIMEE